MKFLVKILEELEKIDMSNTKGFTTKMCPGEEVVAEIDDEETKRLFQLAENYLKKSIVAGEEIRPEYIESAKIDAIQFMEIAEIIADIFWLTVKYKFKLWDKPIGIKDGWKIVTVSGMDEMISSLKNFAMSINNCDGECENCEKAEKIKNCDEDCDNCKIAGSDSENKNPYSTQH